LQQSCEGLHQHKLRARGTEASPLFVRINDSKRQPSSSGARCRNQSAAGEPSGIPIISDEPFFACNSKRGTVFNTKAGPPTSTAYSPVR
ncbi:MAG: hypothetical protein HC883_03305, partial [Bdellovibrionaceae bacterium]|nr:hypothetical protein [Pseudobdellovibrionaceae bacterium]